MAPLGHLCTGIDFVKVASARLPPTSCLSRTSTARLGHVVSWGTGPATCTRSTGCTALVLAFPGEPQSARPYPQKHLLLS